MLDGAMVAQRLHIVVTKEEQDYGFGVVEEPTGVRAVARDVGDGLQAIKVYAEDGSTEYAICDEELRTVGPSARSVEELRRRFPK